MKGKKFLSLLLTGAMSLMFASCSFFEGFLSNGSSSDLSSELSSSSSTIEESDSSNSTPEEELYAFSIAGAPTETVTTGDRIELSASLTLNGASVAGVSAEQSKIFYDMDGNAQEFALKPYEIKWINNL